MKKLFILLTLLFVISACTRMPSYKTPFDTGGKIYKIALLPWKASTMNFEFKYRWTMTQALRAACKQAGAFDLKWSAYPVNGGNVQLIPNMNATQLWEQKKYGNYAPNPEKVSKIASTLGADLALLYNVSADNAVSNDLGSLDSKNDYVRIFIVDPATKQVTVDFIRTDFLNKRAYADVKIITLRAFNKWLLQNK
ncbi:hypothetical protein [Maridesulfovibrio zosterae]|uniref:hypothetical protein n=1 Tax=Maridesulfovibrio zosterae TaxID=82171 RepID=UPI0003FFBED9|nr:hypothetical protein [Maridesulfovibrio zosterae]